MTLVNIISIDGLPLTSTMIQDRVLQLRLASKMIMIALESNFSMKIKVSISKSGVENLTAAFLQRWHGRVDLVCTHRCTSGCKWFKEVRCALLSAKLRPLSLLSLAVDGDDLHSVVKTLVGMGTSIKQLEITFCGKGTELLAASASLASLSHTLTMKISFRGSDLEGRTTTSCLQRLAESSIRISSVSFGSVC
jgi:hypothetical protein